MKVRAFYTTGNKDIKEYRYEKPELGDDEIEVQNVYTGICSSDLAMYSGKFQLLPREIQGHEGLGVVTKVGKNVKEVYIGNCVATRGEPAFADFYNAKEGTFVVVPEMHPRYIIEPIACAINIAQHITFSELSSPILILGTGCLAMIIHRYLTTLKVPLDCTVVGAANHDYWSGKVKLLSEEEFKQKPSQFDVVIDMSDKADYLALPIFKDNAHMIFGAEKSAPFSTTFAAFLWKGMEVSFPSPRNKHFYNTMELAVKLIHNNQLYVDDIWTHEFSRSKVIKAFARSFEKSPTFKRSYLIWR